MDLAWPACFFSFLFWGGVNNKKKHFLRCADQFEAVRQWAPKGPNAISHDPRNFINQRDDYSRSALATPAPANARNRPPPPIPCCLRLWARFNQKYYQFTARPPTNKIELRAELLLSAKTSTMILLSVYRRASHSFRNGSHSTCTLILPSSASTSSSSLARSLSLT